MSKKEVIDTSFEQIRKALKEVDQARMTDGISKDEKELLEISALALRKSERLLIKKEQKELASMLSAMEDELKALSKDMRTRVANMNKVSKGLDITEKILKEVLRVLKIVEKFINL